MSTMRSRCGRSPDRELLLVDEVVHAVHRHRRLHAWCRRPRTRAGTRAVRGERGERGEVAARRAAGDRDERRVAAVLGDVLLDPRDRALHVDDVRRPPRLRREAVVDRDAHPAAFGEVRHQRVRLARLAARHPRAAGDLHATPVPRRPCQVGARPHVEQVSLAVLAVRGVGGAQVPRRLPRARARSRCW